MGLPLLAILADFGKPPDPGPSAAGESADPRDPAEPPAPDASTDKAGEGETDTEGQAEAIAALCSEHARALAALEDAFDARLAEERRRWSVEQADMLAGQIEGAIEALEARIADATARVLRPFLQDEIRLRALEALSDAVGTILAGGEAGAIRISGPDDLLTALKDRLKPCPATVEWEVADRTEVRMVARETVIESEMARWVGLLQEAGR